MRTPKAAVLARLRMLAGFELFDIVLFGWLVFVLRAAPAAPANLAGFTLFALQLVVGASYWLVKGHQVRSGLTEPPGIGVFRWLRLGCELGLVFGLVVVGFGVLAADSWSDWLPGVLLFALAVAEYVNYFHWQLMYDNRADIRRLVRTGRLRRSHLYADLLADGRRTTS
ncbi:multidrug transporter [Kribbella sp. CA-293567]|uniref:multidrug transporter n=1 Tax=Kribbella sp. CA-293567 TaxID=3002436 RepID=UPI0022DD6DB2|nr:multidrug transporter [Kribbella sp. CA-293567]WBQ07576.1 multidrug transporter [Kribbella sp. CA-293567]